MTKMNFGDQPAVVEVYAAKADEGNCINYKFVSTDQKAKLGGMSVKRAVEFVLQKCEIDALTEIYKRDVENLIASKPNFSVNIYGKQLDVKKEEGTGNVLVDERENTIADSAYWDTTKDQSGNSFALCKIRIVDPPGEGGLERKL